ncbi:J domain-containing protein [Motilimonas cestriensis]|uniref:J domain-containing protein n=1 Tax=Motilimonas cestriensis TaxID=2742685 RepID=A0ABS8WBR2_9GAMM|nr:J domain-containing protein [Motilimonas cestriensis]MCE2595143.1 J domain-containing protein [Motilimonas cestriensis]
MSNFADHQALSSFSVPENETELVGFGDPEVPLLLQQVSEIAHHQQQLGQDADVVYQHFMAELGPAEQALINLKRQQLKHLIGFIADKSLTDQERKALMAWLLQDITVLGEHIFMGQEKVQQLWRALTETFLRYCQRVGGIPDGETLSNLQQLLVKLTGVETRFETSLLLDLMAQPDGLQTVLDDCSQVKEAEQRHSSKTKAAEAALQDDAKLADKLFKNKKIAKIYKRLASLLHPDKEPDESNKQVKQALMQQLADAKKNRNVLTLLRLYQSHGDTKTTLDPATSSDLATWLKQQGVQLSQTYQQTLTADTPKMWAWRRFSHSNATFEQQLKQQFQQLEQTNVQLKQFIAQVTGPTQLRAALQQRNITCKK